MFSRKVIIVFLLVMSTLIFSCSSAPRFTSKKDVISKNSETVKSKQISLNSGINSTVYNDSAVLETVTGIASYYAHAFNGKITYSGEVYNMYGISAAHQTYPMGTVLRITNLENGKAVVLKVNDRMPYSPDRIIDLSLGTAEKLDMVKDGLAKVRIDVFKFGKGR